MMKQPKDKSVVKKDARFKIPNSVKMKVIRYFKNNSNNSTTAIAKHYKLKLRTVNTILDNHLKQTLKLK